MTQKKLSWNKGYQLHKTSMIEGWLTSNEQSWPGAKHRLDIT